MDYKSPFFSIILSAYNCEKYISEAVESILNQTFKNFEILIADDCSLDNTRNILSSLASKDSRIRLLKNKQNIGLTKSLNNLIDCAKGLFIVRMDGDDLSLPERLENFHIFYKKNPSVNVYTTPAYLFCKNSKEKLIPNYIIRNYFDPSILNYVNCLIHGTLIIKASLIQHVKYDEKYKYSQDFELYHRLIKMGYKINYDKNNTTYLLRRHGNQISYKQKDLQIHFFNDILERYSPINIKSKFLFNLVKKFFYIKLLFKV